MVTRVLVSRVCHATRSMPDDEHARATRGRAPLDGPDTFDAAEAPRRGEGPLSRLWEVSAFAATVPAARSTGDAGFVDGPGRVLHVRILDEPGPGRYFDDGWHPPGEDEREAVFLPRERANRCR